MRNDLRRTPCLGKRDSIDSGFSNFCVAVPRRRAKRRHRFFHLQKSDDADCLNAHFRVVVLQCHCRRSQRFWPTKFLECAQRALPHKGGGMINQRQKHCCRRWIFQFGKAIGSGGSDIRVPVNDAFREGIRCIDPVKCAQRNRRLLPKAGVRISDCRAEKWYCFRQAGIGKSDDGYTAFADVAGAKCLCDFANVDSVFKDASHRSGSRSLFQEKGNIDREGRRRTIALTW
ncbi:protein of unknown function [Hyphomicrobium sp. MC1]|nr:protein of unknown function [Hyphomicrobium sp. MC1]